MSDFDAIVVGSGAGGAPIAHTLSKAGLRVLVLEKGRRLTQADFLHDEISMCRRDRFLPWPSRDPHVMMRNSGRSVGNEAWTSRCVGGGTVHMSGFFFRLHEDDFELASRYQPKGSTAIDWPFGYDELAPWYDYVEKVVGVSGNTSKNPHGPPRQGDFPYPPVVTHPVSAWIDDAAQELGWNAFDVPRGIITKDKDERMACAYCPLCGSYGCETGAKSSTLASLIPEAEKTGRCEVRAESMATRVVMQKDGRAKGVAYLDSSGQEHVVEAKHVFIAASAVESARLLLLSKSELHPDGLGNRNSQLGRNLCFSTLAQLSGRFYYEDFEGQKLQDLKMNSPFVGRAIQDFYRVPAGGDLYGQAGSFHLLWAHPNPIYAADELVNDRFMYGAALNDAMKDRFLNSRTLEVECFSPWLPTEGCRVELDNKETDAFGLPAARIHIDRHPADLAMSQVLASRAQELLVKLGLREIHTHSVGAETLVLQQGTCRMGKDPRTSVTTKQGNLHEVNNVYVSCGGSLPGGGGVPITLSIMANAFRIADAFIKRS